MPVFIHLQEKMTGWLDCWLAVFAIVNICEYGCPFIDVPCWMVNVFAVIQYESNEQVHPKMTKLLEPLEEGPVSHCFNEFLLGIQC